MRRHETPNAVMTTLASPEVNGAELAVWRVEMAPGAAGPAHTLDREQTLVVLAGELSADVAGSARVLAAGDALTIPAGVVRRIGNAGGVPAQALVASRPGATAATGEREGVPVPWSA